MDDQLIAAVTARGPDHMEHVTRRAPGNPAALPTPKNAILQRLQRHRDELGAAGRSIGFAAGSHLETGIPAPVYFLEDGLVLEIAREEGRHAAIRCVGREGFFSPDLLHGDATVSSAYCLTEIRATVVDCETVVRICAADSAGRELFADYARAAFSEVSQNLVAITHLKFEQRLARWLWVCFDRSGLAALQLTHDALAKLLGVRRASVTVGLHVLEGEHAIKATRGCIQLRDGDRLRALAC